MKSMSGRRLDPVARELVEANLPLVGHLVREAMNRVPAHVHVDDLTSAATTALVLAAGNFEPERGVPFAAYARLCIRGALVDELRSMDWASRRVRRSARALQALEDELTGTLGRAPSTDELAAATGMSPAEVADVRRDADRAVVLSLDAADGVEPAVSATGEDPESIILTREKLGYLHDALAELPERLRSVVTAYFLEQRPQQEIAASLGVTPSRVSQLQAEALRMLHAALGRHLRPQSVPTRTARSARMALVTDDYVRAVAARSSVGHRLDATTTLGDEYRPAVRQQLGA
jgi:RNA polymerase sigma factor for flagellar operon FliA